MLLVGSVLLVRCLNKKQSNKNKYHFHFSLADFVFEGEGGSPLLLNGKPCCFTVLS